MTDHYFTARPGSGGQQRDFQIDLLGRPLAVRTAPGVFSAEHLDHATAHLLRHLVDSEEHPRRVLDLGCGWGPIALALALRWPDAEVWAVDVNDRALELTTHNAERHDLAVRVERPEDVPDDLTFDAIWSNPPVRIGKAALHELLLTWLDRLSPGGAMTMVVGRNLGADSLHRWLDAQGHPTERVGSAKGFRILRTTRD